MINYKDHLVFLDTTIKEALKKLNHLAKDAILFVVDKKFKLIGSITDGDIRRGILNEIQIEGPVNDIIQDNPKFIVKGQVELDKLIEYRDGNYKIIPVVNKNNVIVNIINFRKLKSYLPIDAVIMAGGKGSRLMPLTAKTPKPLLKVGNKPIIQHNLDRLTLFGIDDFWISINYLGNLVEEFIGNGENKNININYIKENIPMGTIGSLSHVNNFIHDTILLTNSDIITNIDYEQFFLDFIKRDADLSVVTVPYQVSIPYGVLESSNGHIMSLKEKPTYTYYSNGGIYLIKKEILQYLPKGVFYNTTDLIEKLISKKKKVISFPLSNYWIDIGKHEDYVKANRDIENIKF